MSKRHVNWSDSPTGGSHRRNDSGVGPFSDSESPKSSNDYDDPYSTIKRLQEAFLKVSEQKEKYKKKAEELDLDLIKVKAERDQAKKDLVEKEAHWRGVLERNELLDSDNKTLKKENKTLQEEVERLEKELRRANRNSNSPPSSMTGALPVETSSDDKTIRRSSSQRKSRRGSVSHKDFDRALRRQQEDEEREKERERAEKEQEMRLRRRMGNSPGDESDANNSKSSSGSRKSRDSRTSYIEPLGEPAPRPPPQIPQSPRGANSHSRGAHYPQYSTQQYAQPSYTSHRAEPVSGNVPRSIRPQVYYDGGSTVDEYAGGYQPYPLPRR